MKDSLLGVQGWKSRVGYTVNPCCGPSCAVHWAVAVHLSWLALQKLEISTGLRAISGQTRRTHSPVLHIQHYILYTVSLCLPRSFWAVETDCFPKSCRGRKKWNKNMGEEKGKRREWSCKIIQKLNRCSSCHAGTGIDTHAVLWSLKSVCVFLCLAETAMQNSYWVL